MSEKIKNTKKKFEGIAEKSEHEPKLKAIIDKLIADGYTHPGESLKITGFATAETVKFYGMVRKRASNAGVAVAVIELVALMNPPVDIDGKRKKKFPTRRKDGDYLIYVLKKAGYTATAEPGDIGDNVVTADYYIFLKKQLKKT
jgi:hypothetical protein